MELENIFGKTPAIKMLDFLIDNRGPDYSKTEIAKRSGISWSTISRHLDVLQDWNLVTPTRNIGRATMYKLNEENPIINQLLALDKAATTWASQEYGCGHGVVVG